MLSEQQQIGKLTRQLEGARADAQELLAVLSALRRQAVDPRLLRWCEWPGCWKSFDATTGPGEGGWMRVDARRVVLCPKHYTAGHNPTTTVIRDDARRVIDLVPACECGAKRNLGDFAVYADAQAWWSTHVTEVFTPRMCLQPHPHDDQQFCVKYLVPGGDYHGGGHMFTNEAGRRALESGEYDPHEVLESMRPVPAHTDEQCRPGCADREGERAPAEQSQASAG